MTTSSDVRSTCADFHHLRIAGGGFDPIARFRSRVPSVPSAFSNSGVSKNSAGTCRFCRGNEQWDWFRDLDSNQDTQLQRLMSYRLDDPGTDETDDRSVPKA
jgi:hypothetical protein